MSDPIDITPAGIAKALEGVTRGPWAVCGSNLNHVKPIPQDSFFAPISTSFSTSMWVEGDGWQKFDHSIANANFISYARNALPLIAAHIAELEAVIDSAEIRNGLTDNGSMWRFWAKKAREALDMQAVAHAAGYRAGVEDAANRITASIQMLRNLGMTENAEAFVAAAEDIRALVDGEADAALQTKGGA